VVNSRRGASRLGCLLGLLLIVAAAYFAVNIGTVYLRSYRFRDAMAQEVRFSETRDDEEIRRRLAALADSLGLPEEAAQVQIRREARSIVVSSDYSELVELPMFVRLIRFNPQVSRSW
jgi:hypothetical protein